MAALHLAEVKYYDGSGYTRVKLCTDATEQGVMAKAAGFIAQLPLSSQGRATATYAGSTQRTEERRG